MKKYLLLGALCTVLLMTGCKKDSVKGRVFNMGATIEGLTGEDKVRLVNDRWIYWDEQDAISVASNSTGVVEDLDTKHDRTSTGYTDNCAVQGLLTISGTQKGTFYMTLPEDAWEFCALYPYSKYNYIKKDESGYNIICHVPATQPFRADEFGDYTFSKQGCPMVGYTDDIDIQFHALCGIVRVELLSTDPKIIKEISFTEASSPTKQISGNFGVKGYTTADPYMIQKVEDQEDGRSVTINCGTAGRAISSSKMLTFYLTLPATSDIASVPYKLTMKVTTTDDKSFTKTMTVNVRRRAITKLRSLTIKDWTTGSADQGIVGNGTQFRPFQIYTAADLEKIRTAFGDGTSDAYINGIKVTSETYFQIMRSDIELKTSNWTSGIKGFVGHITDVVSGTPGIKNNSGVPIFESIKNGGVVEGVTVKVTANNLTAPTSQAFVSPLCGENRGKIINCITSVNHHFTRGSNTTGEAGGIAAICVRNYNTVSGCAFNCSNPGYLGDQDGVVAGIVLFNESGATISNCETQSTARFSCTRSSVGGICYKNAGTIDGCSSYLMGINNGNFHLGGIAFSNSGAVKNCVVTSTTTISLQYWTTPTEVEPTLGGIVNSNIGGTVDYCYVTASLSAPGIVGGIASSVTDGEIINCWVVGSTLNGTSTNYIGGLVGKMTGGKLINSYARATMSSSGTNRLGYAVGQIDGGTVANCYCTAGTTTNAAKFYASFIGGEVSGYAYNSTARGVTSFQNNSSGVPMVDNSTSLIYKLNSGVTSGYHSWVVSGNYPVLSPSVASKSHRGSAKRR